MKSILLLFCFISTLCFNDLSMAQTHVLLTIDVESLKAGNPKTDIRGQFQGYTGEYGVPLIIDLLEKNNSKATFYLNVYEIAKHGDTEIKKIAQEILDRGQDLQLHTHPKPMYGKDGMSKFPYAKQFEILKKGVDLIFEWTGKRVIAHRAGGYLANTITLRALKDSGIILDSSLSPAYNSPLSMEGHKENDVVKIGGLLQIPVTYFTELKFGGWESKRFLDIESTSLRELKFILNNMADEGSCTANIMMHSFSFTRYGYPDYKIIEKLDLLLEYIQAHPKLTATDTESFVKAYGENSLSCNSQPGFIPHTGFFFTYLRSWERFSDGWKNIVFALSLPFLLISLMAFTVLLKRMVYNSPVIEKQ